MSDETIPQMRDRIKELEKENGTLKETASKAQSEVRRLTAREVFRSQGYSPEHGDLFAKSVTDGDVTADAVNEFAGKYNLNPVETSSGEEQTTETDGEEDSGGSDASTALAGMSGGSSGSGSGGQQSTGGKVLTKQEYMELQASDPVAAREALMGGRVQLRADNPFAVRS